MDEKMYDEVGANYRFFLKWRHAAFAGNFIVIGATISICFSAFKNASEILWILPLVASPVGILLWVIDVRTRDLYHATIDAGELLEGKTHGFYSRLATDVRIPPNTSPFSKLTQSAALNISFIGSSLFMLALAALFGYKYS